MKENSTIVIPIQFKSNKAWSSFENQIFKKLKVWNKHEKYKWKRVNYSSEKNTEYEICTKVFFDSNSEKLERERTYFYDEAYRILYDEKRNVSSTYALVYTGENPDEVTFNSNKANEKLYVKFDTGKREVRKLYVYLSNSHIGLLIVEFSEYEYTDDNQDNNIENVVNSKRQICIGTDTKPEDLVEWILGKKSKKLDYVFPYQRKCYLALYKYKNEDNTTTENSEVKELDKNSSPTENLEVKELDIKNIVLDNFIMSGEGTLNERGSFFSHYFQIFWLCILQKTEILHISHMAGRISRKKSARVMKKRCIKVNEEYVLFYNQYDLVECTYAKMGEDLYKNIRNNMNIDKGNEDVREQMRTLHEHAMLKTGEFTSRLLLFISIVSVIIALFEFGIKIYELFFQQDFNSNLNEIICLTNRIRF